MMSKRDGVGLVLVVLAAIALGIDAYVHLDLAKNYVHNKNTPSSHISQAGLFRLEAAISIIIGVLLLVTDNRLVWLGAAATGAGGVFLVVIYRYVNVGKIGPIPNMYEPTWYREKTLSLIAEAALFVIWIAREGRRVQRSHSTANATS